MGYDEEKRLEEADKNYSDRHQEWATEYAREEENKRYNDELEKEKSIIDKENKQLQEEIRQDTFKKVKELYKKGSLFERLLRKVNGLAPNWREIQHYDQESLDYLLRVRSGNTYAQKESLKNIEKLVKDGKRNNVTEKELNSERFEKFANKLGMSKSQLTRDRQMDYAKEHNMPFTVVQELEKVGRSR